MATKAKTAPKKAGRPPSGKTREPFHSYASPETLERFRNAAYWLREPIADLIETAMLAHVQRLEAANGGRFKPRKR